MTKNYKAELLYYKSSMQLAHLKVNGGRGLSAHCKGFADYVAEEIQMTLPNNGMITANWIPNLTKDGALCMQTAANYKDKYGFIRFDNAHNRDVLHMDINHSGTKKQHDSPISMNQFPMSDRRRLSLTSLMNQLETRIDILLPIHFYMPWCLWLEEEYKEVPKMIFHNQPASCTISEFCEAIMHYISFNSSTANAFGPSVAGNRQTRDFFIEAIETVAQIISKDKEFDFKVGDNNIEIIPFPLYCPPGARVDGTRDILRQLNVVSNGNE